MKLFVDSIYKVFPESSLKNNVKCMYHNLFEHNCFKMHFRKNKYILNFNKFNLHFHNNIHHDVWLAINGYFKKYNIKKGDIIIDAGAYPGGFALLSSKMVGSKGKIIAFEPDVGNYKQLLRNIALNNIHNIIVINKGIYSKDTTMKFNNGGTSGASVFVKDTLNKNITYVPVVSLDNELKRLNINKVDFIKMDIEGAEIEAIKGCKKTLKHNNTKLAIASYHILNGEKTCFKLEKLLSKLGYNVETSFSTHLTTYASKS
jgi:FkbM family methyltransferase